MQLPSRSVLAGGLTSLAAWGISLALQAYGFPIPVDTLVPVVALLGTVVTHFVPDSLKDHAADLNVSVQQLAAILPQTYEQYPTGKNGSGRAVSRPPTST